MRQNNFRYVFGVILVVLGILILTENLGLVSNLSFAQDFVIKVDEQLAMTSLNIGIAFLAGMVSFLSPCILPLMPAFLSYLASIGTMKGKK